MGRGAPVCHLPRHYSRTQVHQGLSPAEPLVMAKYAAELNLRWGTFKNFKMMLTVLAHIIDQGLQEEVKASQGRAKVMASAVQGHGGGSFKQGSLERSAEGTRQNLALPAEKAAMAPMQRDELASLNTAQKAQSEIHPLD